MHAVRGLTLSIHRGETVALLGPNGAGKSTTIDMLLGLTRPDTGSVSVFGLTPRQALDAGAVGAMLQTGELVRDLSVRELLQMVISLYSDAHTVDEVLDLTGLGEVADRRTQKLSGGQTQRVRFAVAVAPNPELLVLDEPTVAMDVEARREFWSSMRALTASGKTIVFATHYLDEADVHADRVVLMADGAVVADGPTTEIKALVGGRVIRATLPTVPEGELAELPGVTKVERHGASVTIATSESDTTLRALLNRYAEATDIEVTGAGLEDAFLQLTRPSQAPSQSPSQAPRS